MSEDSFIAVGKLLKPHGLKGELNFTFNFVLRNVRKTPGHFFVQTDGLHVPHVLRHIKLKAGKSGHISFEEFNSRNEAGILKNENIFLKKLEFDEFFEKDISNEIPELIGFEAYDKTTGKLGKIEDIFQLPANSVAQVFISKKEVLIPLVQAYISKIERGQKRIYLEIPNGLLDVYLNS